MPLLIAAIRVYSVIIVLAVIFSWVPAEHRPYELHVFLRKLTDPVLAPVRRILPSAGGLDFSPFVVLIVLSLIARALETM